MHAYRIMSDKTLKLIPRGQFPGITSKHQHVQLNIFYAVIYDMLWLFR